jgi:hypothetical protein
MAYFKRKIKNGKIQIGGEIIVVNINNVLIERHLSAIWIEAWRRLNHQSIPSLTLRSTPRGTIPLYYKDKADSTYFCIGEGRIETPADRIEKNQKQREAIEFTYNKIKQSIMEKGFGANSADRPPLTYPMRFTREQWEAIEWAIDCGIDAATTQFSDDEETATLAPVLQSVLDEINDSKTEEE